MCFLLWRAFQAKPAPLLFTALNNQFFSSNMNAPMANLPVVIYQFAMSPYDNWRELAWGRGVSDYAWVCWD